MIEVQLTEYLESHSQVDAAKLIDRTPAAIWQMIQNKRDIRLVFFDDGRFSHPYEITRLREPGVHPKRAQRTKRATRRGSK